MSALHHYRILHSSTLLYNNSTEDNRIFYLAVNRASVCYDTVIHYTVVTVVCRDFVPDFCSRTGYYGYAVQFRRSDKH